MIKQAVILVGGRGTRLGQLTQLTPKPMMPIGSTSFLDILVEEVARHGFSDIVLLCGYQAQAIVESFDTHTRHRAHIRCLVESQPMGTAGALIPALPLLEDAFALLNGDSLFDINLLDLTTIAPGHAWLGKVALRRLPETGRYGTVSLDHERVISFAEKTGSGPGLINGGVYLLRREALEGLPLPPCSLEQQVLPGLAARGLLFGRAYEGYFIDIGLPEELNRAQEDLPRRRRPSVLLHLRRATNSPLTEDTIAAIKLLNDRGWLVLIGRENGEYQNMSCIQDQIQEELISRGAHADEFFEWTAGTLKELFLNWPIDERRTFIISDEQGSGNYTIVLSQKNALYEIVTSLVDSPFDLSFGR